MQKKKNLAFLASFSLLALCGVAAIPAIANSGTGKAVFGAAATCENGQHVGNEYEGVKPTLSKADFKKSRVCCQCHEVILQKDWTDKGTWTKAGAEPSIAVEESHPAYIPALSLDTLNEKMAALESGVAIDHVTDFSDYCNAVRAENYFNEYIEAGGDKSLVSGLENLDGVKNSLSLRNYFLKEQTFERYGIAYESGLKDEEVGFPYTKATITSTLSTGLPKDRDFAPFKKEAFEGTSGEAQFLIRSNAEVKFLVQAGNKTSSVVTTKPNEWVTITISSDLVSEIKNGETSFLKTGEALPAGFSLDISCYFAHRLDLTQYSVLSNEKYNMPGSLGGLTYAADRQLAANNAWFAGTKTPDNPASWTNAFLDYTISNGTGSAVDNTVQKDTYGGLYFNPGSKTFDNIDEIFLMVHSNEEVALKYARIGDIVRKRHETDSYDIEQTKLHKGWNRIDIKKDVVSGKTFSGHFLQIVPETFSTTLKLVETAIFYSQSAE